MVGRPVAISSRYVSERGLIKQTYAFTSFSQIILEKTVRNEPEKENQITHWLGEATSQFIAFGMSAPHIERPRGREYLDR